MVHKSIQMSIALELGNLRDIHRAPSLTTRGHAAAFHTRDTDSFGGEILADSLLGYVPESASVREFALFDRIKDSLSKYLYK